MTIEGYTSIASARVELRGLNVLVGANGAGKSNFVSALEMLGRIADGDVQLFVGLHGGAATLLHDNPKAAAGILLRLDAPPNGYEARLVPGSRDDLVFDMERVIFRGSENDDPYTKLLGRGHRETLLNEQIEAEGSQSIAGHVVEVLDACRVYHFHDTSRAAPVKLFASPSDNIILDPYAGNLASFLLRVQASDRPAYQRIVRAIQQIAPFFRDFVLREEGPGVRLRWRQVGLDRVLGPESFSDGTLRFICLATLLLQPQPPALIVLDEPELGLHPFALVQLAGMLQAAATSSQVVVATQSVPLVDQFELDDLVVVDRERGSSTFHRPEREQLKAWLEDYSLGDLWQKNLLGGTPRRENT